MFREIEPLGGTAGGIGVVATLRHPDGGSAGRAKLAAVLRHPESGPTKVNFAVALRHPDGTINFDAYRERARRARTKAIRSSVTQVFSLIGRAFAV